MSDERAFAAAVAKLGPKGELGAEHTKNRSALGTLCAVAARLDGTPTSGGQRGLLIAHGVLWASLILATSILVSKTSARATFGSWLILIYIPLWMGSEQILRRALRNGPRRGAR